MCAELLSEPVERVHGRGPADRFLECGMLGDQPGGAAPGRDRVQALGEARTDERAGRVAPSACPAQPLELRDQLGRSRVSRGGRRQTLRAGRAGLVPSGLPSELLPLLVTAPGSANFAGASICVTLNLTEILLYCAVLGRSGARIWSLWDADRRSRRYALSRGSRGGSDRRD